MNLPLFSLAGWLAVLVCLGHMLSPMYRRCNKFQCQYNFVHLFKILNGSLPTGDQCHFVRFTLTCLVKRVSSPSPHILISCINRCLFASFLYFSFQRWRNPFIVSVIKFIYFALDFFFFFLKFLLFYFFTRSQNIV